MHVSVVIPTFERGVVLKAALQALLRNDCSGVKGVEIIVVDDGSQTPASEVLDNCEAGHPFELRCIRQPNGGPAKARNTGFRFSRGGIVIFVDDDIISGRDLIQQHVIAHRKRPQSVIFGRCPLVPVEAETPFYRYINSLSNDPGEGVAEEFIESPLVASGHLSVERQTFAAMGSVYSEHLVTPGAEEFELSCRLRRERIPILLGTGIVGMHSQAVDLQAICRQQHKYGFGCAEVFQKCPETREMAELKDIINRAYEGWRRIMGLAAVQHGAALTAPLLRKLSIHAAMLVEQITPRTRVLPRLYRAAIGVHFITGVYEGSKVFPQA